MARPTARECGTEKSAPKRASTPSMVSRDVVRYARAARRTAPATGFSTNPPLSRMKASAARARPTETIAAAVSARPVRGWRSVRGGPGPPG